MTSARYVSPETDGRRAELADLLNSEQSALRPQRDKLKPLIAQRFPLRLAEARYAQELLGNGGVTGKIVLVGNVARERP